MRNRFMFLLMLFALITLAPTLQAEEASAGAQLLPPSATHDPAAVPSESAEDCPDVAPASTASLFDDFASSLDAKAGAKDTAVCTPEYRTTYVCNCNISGSIRFRKLNQYRECCGISCSQWQTTSSSCTNYTC